MCTLLSRPTCARNGNGRAVQRQQDCSDALSRLAARYDAPDERFVFSLPPPSARAIHDTESAKAAHADSLRCIANFIYAPVAGWNQTHSTAPNSSYYQINIKHPRKPYSDQFLQKFANRTHFTQNHYPNPTAKTNPTPKTPPTRTNYHTPTRSNYHSQAQIFVLCSTPTSRRDTSGRRQKLPAGLGR